jgi:hypothetical protein
VTPATFGTRQTNEYSFVWGLCRPARCYFDRPDPKFHHPRGSLLPAVTVHHWAGIKISPPGGIKATPPAAKAKAFSTHGNAASHRAPVWQVGCGDVALGCTTGVADSNPVARFSESWHTHADTHDGHTHTHMHTHTHAPNPRDARRERCARTRSLDPGGTLDPELKKP